MILLTDGHNNAGRVDPLVAAKAADALGIRIYTIGVGSKRAHVAADCSACFALVGANSTSRCCEHRGPDGRAVLPGGRHRGAQGGLRHHRCTRKTTAEATVFVHREERFQARGVWGLVFLVLSTLLGETTWRRAR